MDSPGSVLIEGFVSGSQWILASLASGRTRLQKHPQTNVAASLQVGVNR